jgi:TnpA family transposase
LALRELGRTERALCTLEWIQSPELRHRVHLGLNKGEARNSLARAIFFYRRGAVRDRLREDLQNKASGLNLLVAAIILWNTVYLEQGVAGTRTTREAGSTRMFAPLFTAWLGTHQFDRRLHLGSASDHNNATATDAPAEYP